MRIYFSSACSDGDYFIYRLTCVHDEDPSWEEIDKMQIEANGFGAGSIHTFDLALPGVYGIRSHYGHAMYCCMVALPSGGALRIIEVTEDQARRLLAALPDLQ